MISTKIFRGRSLTNHTFLNGFAKPLEKIFEMAESAAVRFFSGSDCRDT